MRYSSLVSSLLLAVSCVAFADTGDADIVDPDASSSDAEEAASPNEEITVYGEAEILRRRGEVIQNLRHLGYREARRKDGRIVMVSKIPYRPSVILDDDAWMQVKRSPVRIDPPGDSNWRYLWCLPPFTVTAACIQVGGQVIGRRKLAPFKADVVRATRYEMREWQNAVVANAMEQRLNQELPDMLDATWTTGRPMGNDGPFLKEYSDRRSAIFAFWASRSCVPEGEQVREVVSTFIDAQIQTSAHPASAEERANANKAQRCEDAERFTVE
jgi:hypothetical protein